MKSKNLKTKLFTTVLATMLIAPTVLGVAPIGENNIFSPTVVSADTLNASFEWVDGQEAWGQGSAKTQQIVASDGTSLTVYVYQLTEGQIKVDVRVTGNMGGKTLGDIDTTTEGYKTVSGSLEDLDIEDTITVGVNVKQQGTAPIEKPTAPTNVVIYSNGEAVEFGLPENTRGIVFDSKGSELGRNGSGYVELNRTLSQGETISVVAENKDSGLRSDPTYATYMEAPKEATITVSYIDELGKPLAQNGSVSGQVGTVVNVEAISIDGYDLLTQSPQGVVVEEGASITFIYRQKEVAPVEKKATLTTKFVDEKGNDVASATTQEVVVGTTYTAQAKSVSGYTVKGSATVTGTMGESGATETFIYTKNSVTPPVEVKATLTTKFVDEKGNDVASATTQEVVVGKDYTTKAKTVSGYKLKGSDTITGTMVDGGKTETFVYVKDAVTPPVEVKATLTTKFVDEKGNDVASATTQEVVVGKDYTTKAKTVSGYTVRGTGTIQGVMADGGKTETFVYDKVDVPTPVEKQVLTIQYLDADSLESIKETRTESHDKGSTVTVKADSIKGYDVSGDSTYTLVMDDNYQVTFLYTKQKGEVVKPENAKNVKFVEGTKGTEITADVPKGTTLVVEYDGDVIAESSTSGKIKLSKSVPTGAEIQYSTVNAEGTFSDSAKLVRTDVDVNPVDFSKLQELVDTTKKIDFDKYTEDSVTKVRIELINADKVLADGSSTQAQVDAQYKALKDAVDGLKEVTDVEEPTTPTEPTTPVKPTTPSEDNGSNGGTTKPSETNDTTGKTDAKDTKDSTKDSKETVATTTDSKKSDKLKASGKVNGTYVGLGAVLVAIGTGFGLFNRKSKKENE